THDNRILDVADRIIHMEDGALVSNSELTPNNQLTSNT
ncbi:MAG: ABC transporter, partial [Planktothrix sp.]